MSEISSEIKEMTFTAEAVREEMRQHVSAVAALAPEDNRKAALRFAASVLKLPFSRVKSLFYGEARRVDAHEADRIRAYVQAASDLIEARAKLEARCREFAATAHPALVRLAPGPVEGKAVSETVRPTAEKLNQIR